MAEKCYCGQLKNKKECCEPFLNGLSLPETAEQLMRSRYSAYVTGNIDYIMNTHHISTRPIKEKKAILKWTLSVKWLGLTVHSTKDGLSKNNNGYVSFTALFLENGKMDKIQENSYFIKESGHWYYAPM